MLEAKGLKMNTGKTKVLFSCSMKDKVEGIVWYGITFNVPLNTV